MRMGKRLVLRRTSRFTSLFPRFNAALALPVDQILSTAWPPASGQLAVPQYGQKTNKTTLEKQPMFLMEEIFEQPAVYGK